MAKHVFKPSEITNLTKKVIIAPPIAKEIETVEEEFAEDDSKEQMLELQKEVEEFRHNWENEKTRMIEEARVEAEKIIQEAEELAFEKVKEKTNEAQKIRQEASSEVKKVIDEAKEQGLKIERETEEKVQLIEKQAYERGYKEGHEKGFASGEQEVERLIQRLHAIISKTIEKRNEIVEESETQLINMVLLIAKKVIKVISENQKNVVINNVMQALLKLKGGGDVVIKVNPDDLDLTSSHIDSFLKRLEQGRNVSILEDTSVDRGGCVIETDFGQINARISSQLHEIEEKILEMMPITAKAMGD
ncbi:MAG: flagellar assembly protein FliH [Spirochaetales bacterium]|nr:flagellar assembly protein FliH [Spirochaetales bacterium]